MNENETIAPLAEQLGISIKEDQLSLGKQILVNRVNELIIHDFERLVGLLYRLDIPEKKITQLLAEHMQQDAAVLITDLMITREMEKIKSRQAYRRDDNIAEEDKW
jgi:hypothetical protein